ncbi:unnamed protein product [Acanthoscelides obtectus]|uniref:Uncharacterized protein n=1 Tax=Acanthoscelides obtectus TaxID=200917 RepID=A0A9P0LQI6_ACAOB|nr:unnamed protein product [Acanthoscelides obtectus]CAK1675902.1 Protein ZBED8 [Acanthoscelides obtectus]
MGAQHPTPSDKPVSKMKKKNQSSEEQLFIPELKVDKRPTLDRMFASTSQRNDDGLRASYNISLLIAKSGKPHTIGEKLILPAVEEVLKTVLHKPASDIIKINPLSNNTVERRIDEMSSDIESFLCNYLQTTHVSIQLDESTLPDNAALLLAYVRVIMNQEIYEELLFARTLITDTKGESMFHVLKDYFIEKAIPLSNIISVATDRAPAMVRSSMTGSGKKNPRTQRSTACIVRIFRETKQDEFGVKQYLLHSQVVRERIAVLPVLPTLTVSYYEEDKCQKDTQSMVSKLASTKQDECGVKYYQLDSQVVLERNAVLHLTRDITTRRILNR